MVTTGLLKSARSIALAIWLGMAIVGTRGYVAAAPPPDDVVDDVVDDPGPAMPHDEAGGRLMDDLFMEIAERVPEFGGMYVDGEANTLFIHVTERRPGLKAALRRAIHDVFPSLFLPERMRLLDARFSFEQLMRWHHNAGGVFAIPGVTQTDINDRENRLQIGVMARGLEGMVEQELTAAGIPPEGWQIEEVQPAEMVSSVGDTHRPLRGGLEIGPLSFGFCSRVCTLGFVVIHDNDSTGFVTASHCTNTQGGEENTEFVQECFLGGNVGTELIDPVYFTHAEDSRCPSTCGLGVSQGTCHCRFSDSAYVLGRFDTEMKRTIVKNSIGSLAWDGISRYPVISETSPVVGMMVHKLGRTTGNTLGEVTSVCTDMAQFNSRRLILCQAGAPGLGPEGGDSGSPIFTTTSCSVDGQSRCARLIGLLWGSNGNFSPMANIQRSGELGPLTTCFNGGC